MEPPLAQTSMIPENGDGSFDCHAQSKPAPSIEWLRNGVRLLDDGRSVIVKNISVDQINDSIRMVSSRLILKRVNRNDGGTIICRASNAGGSVETQSTNLKIACKSFYKVNKIGTVLKFYLFSSYSYYSNQ